MHGRVKVRTTEEERERKKKEQALKMRAYRAVMSRIQQKRTAGELDDEMLTLTVQVLQRNPDVSTLWNIRRECVLVKISLLQEQQQQQQHQQEEEKAVEEETKTEDGTSTTTTTPITPSIADQLQAIYANELQVTEQCLMINPKSYNGWHHRCWTLEQNPQADWQREVQLCNKYLKYDERNFHTWDYRRYVIEKAQVPRQQELDFCTEKIKVNFSNYSSWHHRSLLLPILYPYEGTAQPKRPMSEEKLKQELEMVLTAAFTDPNDSSAWFYQRWLLGSGVISEAPAVAAFRCNSKLAVIAFTKSNPNFPQSQVELKIPNQSIQLRNWNAIDDNKTSWQCKLSTSLAAFEQQQYSLQIDGVSLSLSTIADGNSIFYFKPPHARVNYTDEVITELKSQLQSCKDLLEFEPDSKWTLLTSALLMRAIDAELHHAESLEHLSKLQTVDALRAGYYKDLAARWCMEIVLAKWQQTPAFPKTFDLIGDNEAAQLTALPYAQYFIIADELHLPLTLNQKHSVQTFAQL